MPQDQAASASAESRDRFEERVRPWFEPLRRYLRRRTDPDTADDVLGDVLLTCWRRADEIPEGLPDDGLPWAYGVARNCLANASRGERRRERLAGRVTALDPPRLEAPPADPPSPAVSAAVSAALDALSTTDAEVLRLWAWEDLSTSEIAVVLDVSPNAASIRLHRARQRLRDRLAGS